MKLGVEEKNQDGTFIDWTILLFFILGVFSTINYIYNRSATLYLRTQNSPIAQMEKAWDACDKVVATEEDRKNWHESYADAFAQEMCRDKVFATFQKKYDTFKAGCGIYSIGNFSNNMFSDGGNLAYKPSYYSVPFSFMFSSACKQMAQEGFSYSH